MTVAVIPARGGSKGIPRKNTITVCGKPLIAWSIEQAQAARGIDSVWVSSDSEEILQTALHCGANPIRRPPEISGDHATSESAWLHALTAIEATNARVSRMIGIQATSPIREATDFDRALDQFVRDDLDSLLSCCEIEDFFIWQTNTGSPIGVNHDYRNRQRRQNIDRRYLENGSFYIFKPEILRRDNNRLGGRIGIYVMDKHKMFQIDGPADIPLVEAIMRGYGMVA